MSSLSDTTLSYGSGTESNSISLPKDLKAPNKNSDWLTHQKFGKQALVMYFKSQGLWKYLDKPEEFKRPSWRKLLIKMAATSIGRKTITDEEYEILKRTRKFKKPEYTFSHSLLVSKEQESWDTKIDKIVSILYLYTLGTDRDYLAVKFHDTRLYMDFWNELCDSYESIGQNKEMQLILNEIQNSEPPKNLDVQSAFLNTHSFLERNFLALERIKDVNFQVHYTDAQKTNILITTLSKDNRFSTFLSLIADNKTRTYIEWKNQFLDFIQGHQFNLCLKSQIISASDNKKEQITSEKNQVSSVKSNEIIAAITELHTQKEIDDALHALKSQKISLHNNNNRNRNESVRNSRGRGRGRGGRSVRVYHNNNNSNNNNNNNNNQQSYQTPPWHNYRNTGRGGRFNRGGGSQRGRGRFYNYNNNNNNSNNNNNNQNNNNNNNNNQNNNNNNNNNRNSNNNYSNNNSNNQYSNNNNQNPPPPNYPPPNRNNYNANVTQEFNGQFFPYAAPAHTQTSSLYANPNGSFFTS